MNRAERRRNHRKPTPTVTFSRCSHSSVPMTAATSSPMGSSGHQPSHATAPIPASRTKNAPPTSASPRGHGSGRARRREAVGGGQTSA
jgi:hypothetical protein